MGFFGLFNREKKETLDEVIRSAKKKIDSEELLTGQSVYKNEQVDEIGNPTKITVTATGKSSSYSMLPVDEISIVAKYYGIEYVEFKTFKIQAF